MTAPVWVIFFHLAGVATYDRDVTFASEAACKRAGEAWLASIRHRNPNDHFECFQRHD